MAQHGAHGTGIIQRRVSESAGNLPVAHAQDAVCQAADIRHAMRDIKDRHPLGFQIFDQREQALGFGI